MHLQSLQQFISTKHEAICNFTIVSTSKDHYTAVYVWHAYPRQDFFNLINRMKAFGSSICSLANVQVPSCVRTITNAHTVHFTGNSQGLFFHFHFLSTLRSPMQTESNKSRIKSNLFRKTKQPRNHALGGGSADGGGEGSALPATPNRRRRRPTATSCATEAHSSTAAQAATSQTLGLDLAIARSLDPAGGRPPPDRRGHWSGSWRRLGFPAVRECSRRFATAGSPGGGVP